MPFASTKTVAKALGIALALVGWAGAKAAEQQASFAVAITLHSISKPLAVAQLCPAGKPLDRVGVAITVSCPDSVGNLNGASMADSERSSRAPSNAARSTPYVVVTF